MCKEPLEVFVIYNITNQLKHFGVDLFALIIFMPYYSFDESGVAKG
jgi:hypothetical protein